MDPGNLDTACAPCQDFYRYANGGWRARAPLPPEYPSYKPRPPGIDCLMPEQRFFLAWAQIWRSQSTNQYVRNQVTVHPQAPALWRLMRPLANLREFAAAFHCAQGDGMVRPDSLRATI